MKYIITIDIDWAPDFMIKPLVDKLMEHDIKATWFITHESPLIKTLNKIENFQVGIHPNLFESSTQGKNEHDIIQNLMKIVPNAKVLRTHGNFQSTNLTIKLSKLYGFKIDSSMFMPRVKETKPYLMNWMNKPILNIPYSWEDSYEASQKEQIWTLKDSFFTQKAPIVMNFHPVHLYLNTIDYETYFLAKTQGAIQNWRPDTNIELVNKQNGPINIFDELMNVERSKLGFLTEYMEMVNKK